MLKKISKIFSFIFKSYPDDVGFLIEYFSRIEVNSRNEKKREYTIAIEGTTNRVYAGMCGLLINGIKNDDLNIDLLWIESFNSAVGDNINAKLYRSTFFHWITFRQWYRLYRFFVNRIAYRSYRFLNPCIELVNYLKARKIFKGIEIDEDFKHYKIDGIVVGDLIIDSYLRFKPSCEFVSNDPFLQKLVRQTLRDLYKAKKYFTNTNPRLYFCSFSTYIQHGVPVRVALMNRTEVRALPDSPISFGKKLDIYDYHHTANFDFYIDQFKELEDKRYKYELAEQAFKQRLSGNIDPAISYMKKSAYASSPDKKKLNVSGAVVIFLHDFFDAPHSRDGLIFNDFWSWIIETIETLSANRINFFIKPHPNQSSESEKVVELLLDKFSKIKIIRASTSNAILFESGIVCGVTAYGTVTHELAYFGIPSIACAKHSTHKYTFCRTANSIEEYRQMLATADLIPCSPIEMKTQSLEYYYIHNLNYSEDKLLLHRQLTNYVNSVRAKSDNNEIIFLMDEINLNREWKNFLGELHGGTH